MRRLAFLTLVLVACGGGSGSRPDAGGPDAGTGTTPASFCRALAERTCAGLSACSCRFDLRPYDAAGCVDARTASCEATFGTRVGPDLASGAAAFHESSVVFCMDAVDDEVELCRLGSDLPRACDTAIMATASVGSPCQVTGGGLAYCAQGAGVCLPGDGTCTALPGDGEACLTGALCDPAPGLVCVDGTCRTPGGMGTPCTSTDRCADWLVCTASGTCGITVSLGEACDREEQCDDGLVCRDQTCQLDLIIGDACDGSASCGADRACARAPETRVCDDPGLTGEACSPGSCAPGLACATASDTCVALPGDGDACLDGSLCAPGLACVDGEAVCRPLPGVGEPCLTASRFCQDGLGCDLDDFTCQAAPGEGELCLANPPDYVCAGGLGCDFGDLSVCVPLGAAGASCQSDRTCGPGTYCDLTVNQCATRLGVGAPCPLGGECASDLECGPGPTGFACTEIPGRDQPCYQACTDALACTGPGGTCAPAICVIP
jgi:hypothetical protein